MFRVRPQPDSPLRLSIKTYWLALKLKTQYTDPNGYEIDYYVENVGELAVSAFALQHAPGEEIPGLCVWDLSPARLLRPGKTDVRTSWGGYTPDAPVLTYEVDFVEFKDGTTWGADVCRSAERLAGERAGAAAAAERLLKLLAADGPDAVLKAVKEELAGWGPYSVLNEAARLGLTKGGAGDARKADEEEESRGVATPPGHSPVWELGFFIGTKQTAQNAKQAVEGYGPDADEIEHALKRPYDAAAAK
ncbi:MAG TPA: hypothetical protein VJ866_09635 [Pyrinomonadaceae bacterium]|nr:hypothetical protein [Pyrinomonadaceae bacterium]